MSNGIIFQQAHTETLYYDLRRANTESAKKERFLQYLTTTFSQDPSAQKLISDMTHGAEQFIANIPRGVLSRTGRADTQTDTIIIEWEKDLRKTGEHAIEQLTDYLMGNWRSGQNYRFVLIATDGILWRMYAPDWSHLRSSHFHLGSEYKLKEISRFELTKETFGEFPFFLDNILFASKPKIATLKKIQIDFGDTSSTFINSMSALNKCIKDLETRSDLKVALDQWRRFLSIAYGRFDDSPEMFLVHTYLSVFAKFIAYAVITKKQILDDATVSTILNGTIFEKLNVERFVEDDFFHWVKSANYINKLKPMFHALNRQLADYNFDEVNEDILKGVYQELIDLDTRHALGEYYTPDWLCERIISELKPNAESRVLDPACGSGSFLRAVVARLRQESKSTTADKIASHVVGIDIHPLSVQIAKTTLLLAFGSLIKDAKSPVILHVYLANSLLVPRASIDLFKSTFTISVDNGQYQLDIAELNEPESFDKLVTFCDDLVIQHKEKVEKIHFLKFVNKALSKYQSPVLADQLYEVYCAMKRARDEGRDSIWKFILQNSYKPVFLGNQFDFIVGNPPWLTYAQIENADYQAMLRALADGYAVTPRGANMPHMEIAAIFLAHSVNHFMKSTGRLAFVLPRSFMTADQHDNTRNGSVKNVQLIHLWDLKDIEPLFRVPCCVVLAKHSERINQQRISSAGISGYIMAGKLPKSQLHWMEASKFLTQKETRWHYSKLHGGKGRSRSALTQNAMVGTVGQNAYENHFKQGATIVPRSCFFIDIEQEGIKGEYAGRVIKVKTSDSSLREAKAPWKVTLSGRIEGDFLFRTALSKSILPFVLVNPQLVVLPVAIEKNKGNREFVLLDYDELMSRDMRNTSKWFWNASKLWEKHRTEKNAKQEISLPDYLNWQNKLTNQDPDACFLVLYTASASDASATVVDCNAFDLPFIVDSKAYWFETNIQAEANYICAFLNSGYANMQIKEFQSRGLFGPRDIHKTIVKLPFPKFYNKNIDHKQLALLGKKCATQILNLFRNDSTFDLQARALGRTRGRIRNSLGIELDEIDVIVEKLSTGKSEAAIRSSGKGKVKKNLINRNLFE